MSWLKRAYSEQEHSEGIEELKRRLLKLGGEGFVIDSWLMTELSPQELSDLLSVGRVHEGDVEMCEGQAIRCHENAAALVLENEGWTMWTGLALSSDGIWRVHSWAENPQGNLVETTRPRDIYFGIVVDNPRRLAGSVQSGGWLKQSEIPQRFTNPDEALSFYNGWIQVSPTDPPSRERDPEFKWDPVLKWYAADGSPLYWYVVGTKDSESLVIESAETFMRWANEYYYYHAQEHGEAEAEALIEKGRVVVERIPDLQPSTPEAEHLLSSVAEDAPEGEPEAEEKEAPNRAEAWLKQAAEDEVGVELLCGKDETIPEAQAMYAIAGPIAENMGGRASFHDPHAEGGETFCDGYVYVAPDRIEALLDELDKQAVEYDNIDLPASLKGSDLHQRLMSRFPRGHGVRVNASRNTKLGQELIAGVKEAIAHERWLNAKKKKKSPAQEKEDARIRENEKKPAAKKQHKFKPAEWTHPNGHPRCLVCGDEETIGGICNKEPSKKDMADFEKELEEELDQN